MTTNEDFVVLGGTSLGDTTVDGILIVTGNTVIAGETVIDSDTFKLRANTPQPLGSGYSYFGVNRGENVGGTANADTYIRWNEPNRYWDIRDVNDANSYYKIITQDLISDSVSLDSSSNVASSRSVKTVNDSVVSSNTAMKSYVDLKDLQIYSNVSILRANTEAFSSHADGAYDQANTATTNAATADQKAVSAGVYANTAITNAATADQRAVTSGVYANTAISDAATAQTHANAGYDWANGAYSLANTKFSSSGGTILGSVAITGTLSIDGDFSVTGTSTVDSDAFLLRANTPQPFGSGYSYFGVNRGANTDAQIRWNEASKYWDLVNIDSNSYFKIITSDLLSSSTTSLSTSNVATSLSVNTVNQNITTANTKLKSYADGTFFTKSGGTISGDATVTGNLTVSGTTTIINTTELQIGDNIITLNADLPGTSTPSQNSGIEINRGTSSNVSLFWNETNDKWSFTNDGANTLIIGSYSGEVQANLATQYATSAGSYANGAFTKANTANTNAATADGKAVTAQSHANAGYNQANTATTNAATAQSHANAGYNQANTATSSSATATQYALSAGSYANSAYIQANTANTNAATADQKAVSAGSYANSAFSKANTATTNAATADQRAVTSGSYANSAFTKANSAYDAANTALAQNPYVEDDENTNATRYITFVDDSTAGYKRLNEDSALNYNPSTNTLTAGVLKTSVITIGENSVTGNGTSILDGFVIDCGTYS